MLKDYITETDIKFILSNSDNKKKYLKALFAETGNDERIGRNKEELDREIIATWDYEISKTILRKLFFESSKYEYDQSCKTKIDQAIIDWNELGYGPLEWPFAPNSFDDFVHQINRRTDISEADKDVLISKEVIKFRRIKEINQYRNDFIECLVVQNNSVIPTFGNVSGIDFYIDGYPYDQKVSRDVGTAFKKKYGQHYREIAISNPALLAQCLYENQDEARFGSKARLFIVYLDQDINSEIIEEQLSNIDLNQPLEVQFTYNHSSQVPTVYTTKCFVLLLHN